MPTPTPIPLAVPAAEQNPAPNGDRKGRGKRRRRWKAQRDWGGILAKLLCVVFAFIGLVPLALGGLVRLDRVQELVADRTATLVERELGVTASYELELTPWPLEIAMENVEVPSNDGGKPFLAARTVLARPRLFSLLAGKLDFGEVEIEEPRVRAVITDGKLENLDYKLPETAESDGEPNLPLSALALTNGSVDIAIDGARVRSHEIDIDVAIAPMPSDRRALIPGGLFEVSMRAGATAVDHAQADPAAPEHEQVNEDALCRLELRAQISDEVLVRRLQLEGAVRLRSGPRHPSSVHRRRQRLAQVVPGDRERAPATRRSAHGDRDPGRAPQGSPPRPRGAPNSRLPAHRWMGGGRSRSGDPRPVGDHSEPSRQHPRRRPRDRWQERRALRAW